MAVLKTYKKPYKVTLPIFEGPLDLLLYLIQKQEVDIYDIPIAQITDQYLQYLEMMELLDLDIAGEFLVMTATLMEVKSRMLLPPEQALEGLETVDPRAELVNRLLEYQKFKEGALRLEQLESIRRDFASRVPASLESFEGIVNPQEEWWDLSLYDLMKAMRGVLETISTQALGQVREVMEELVTVEGRIGWMLEQLLQSPVLYFSELFKKAKSKIEMICTVLASLELAKASEIRLKQEEIFGEVEIVRVNHP